MSDNSTSTEKPATGIPALVQKVMKLKPVRVFQHYASNGGPLMAAGMSFQALFAVFAALWAGFSIAGLVLASNRPLLEELITIIGNAVPGLIGDGGAVDADALLNTPALSWSSAIALVGLVFTALGWLASARDAIRRIFSVGPDTTFFLLLKLKDAGLALGFGIVLVVSAGISIGSTTLIGLAFDLFGIDNTSGFAVVVARIVGLLIAFALDALVLLVFYRVLTGIRIPFRRVISGALIGAAALGVLKALGGLLLGGASNNPLIASFAVIAGLLIFFNLICQVILITAAWISVGVADVGLDVRGLSPEQLEAEAELKQAEARVVVAAAERQRLEDELREAHGLRRRGLSRKLKAAVREESRLKDETPTPR
ncbi:ribonuclease [Agreia sp. Leaf244]|uniref:YihY/virulence factor BrkB family protein n=1 Tax=Agreia sp. Leaf244 TaxID=1736305 RepID=UPI0006F764D6|nr:YihY/virulence factor BrkB family protein [Agreia sp. Leaf244]KQO11179.1 ribonuclease [Agreia sp. Leaf244]